MTASELYLERRTSPRIKYHFTVRFVANPNHPLRLSQGLTQDLSVRGVQVLCSSVPDPNRQFDVWIPVQNDEVVHAKGKLSWASIEDTFSDSPYWVRCGLELTFTKSPDRRKVSKTVELKGALERSQRESQLTKVGYIF